MRTSAMRRLAASVFLTAVVGWGCLTIYDTFHIAVNIDGLDATFPIVPGANPSYSGSVEIRASDYISGDFATIDDVRIYDIRVQTMGTYDGDITGSVRVNGIEFASFAGPWSAFAEEQSVLTDETIAVNPPGMTILINGILEERTLFVEVVGGVSQTPIPNGLEVRIRVLGQVDAEL
jgi:hypothetical protein